MPLAIKPRVRQATPQKVSINIRSSPAKGTSSTTTNPTPPAVPPPASTVNGTHHPIQNHVDLGTLPVRRLGQTRRGSADVVRNLEDRSSAAPLLPLLGKHTKSAVHSDKATVLSDFATLHSPPLLGSIQSHRSLDIELHHPIEGSTGPSENSSVGVTPMSSTRSRAGSLKRASSKNSTSSVQSTMSTNKLTKQVSLASSSSELPQTPPPIITQQAPPQSSTGTPPGGNPASHLQSSEGISKMSLGALGVLSSNNLGASKMSIPKISTVSSSSMTEITPDTLSCSECTQWYSSPVLLPCLHTYCRRCVDIETTSATGTAEDRRSGTGPGRNPNSGKTALCPSCKKRYPVADLITDYFMASQVALAQCHSPEAKLCDICKQDLPDNSSAEASQSMSPAVDLCLQCNDHLCSECSRIHCRTRLTRGHNVVPLDEIRQNIHDSAIRQNHGVPCPYHPATMMNAYCDNCDIMVCNECSPDHRNHKMAAMGDQSTATVDQIRELLEEASRREPGLAKYDSFLEAYRNNLKLITVEVMQEIESHTKSLHRLIDKEKDATMQKVKTAVSREVQTLEDCKDGCKKALQAFKQGKGYATKLISNGKPEEILMAKKTVHARLKELSNMHVEHLTHHLVLDLKIGNLNVNHPEETFGHAEIKHNVMTAKFYRKVYGRNVELGMIQPAINNVQLVASFNTRTDNDQHDPHLTGVCVNADDDIHVVDQSNASVKIYSSTGKLIRIYQQCADYEFSKPHDITALDSGCIAVSDAGHKNVVILNQEGAHVTTASSYVTHPRGMVGTHDSHVIVLETSKPEIKLFDTQNGERIRAIYSNQNENDPNILKDPHYVAMSPDGHIMVTDGKPPYLHIFTGSGKITRKQHSFHADGDHQIIQPRGICVDRYGYIMVADQQADCVCLLTPSAKFLRSVVSAQNGIKQPIALTINKNGHLVVTEQPGTVKVFQYV